MPSAPITSLPINNNIFTGYGNNLPTAEIVPNPPIGAVPPGTPAAVTPPQPPPPNFQDIQKILNPSGGISPQIQSVLDLINKNTEEARKKSVAEATSLAARRGLAGSSIEQFGIAQAAKSAEEAGQTATANALLQNANQQADSAKALASLTSDEIASLRNMDFAQQNLALQKYLGERGIDISAENIAASRDIAKQRGQNDLYSAIISGTLPAIIGGGGNGGGIFSFLGKGGGGSTVAGGATLTGTATPGVTAGSSVVPVAGTTVGTGSPVLFGSGGTILNTAGTSTIGAGSILPGLAGYQLGRTISPATQEGDNASQNIGAVVGGGAGSAFGPAGTFVGATAGSLAGKASNRLQSGIENKLGQTAGDIASITVNPIQGIKKGIDNLKDPKKAVSKVSKAVSNVFCFSGDTPISMMDGTDIKIKDLKLGDNTLGGIVESIRISISDDGTVYDRLGVIVTGEHAVREYGEWVRVKNSKFSNPIKGSSIVYSIVTSHHRIYVNGSVFADEHETNEYEYLSLDQSLEKLNEDEKKNSLVSVGGDNNGR